ncbi:hypothetical protein C8R47DRAFT_210739 [Mycena vitilis]|nr:hypothetical protein C8R47DRAFT_210739 [Mycena vitilis]
MLFPIALTLVTIVVAVPLPIVIRQAQAPTVDVCDANSGVDDFGGTNTMPDCGGPMVCSAPPFSLSTTCNFKGTALQVTAATAANGSAAVQICDPEAAGSDSLQCSFPVTCAGSTCTFGNGRGPLSVTPTEVKKAKAAQPVAEVALPLSVY